MPTDRLARLRSWPSGVYTDALARLWRAEHPVRTPSVQVRSGLTTVSGMRVAAICHLYYLDLLDEVRDAVAALPEGSDLFVSVIDTPTRDAVTAGLDAVVSGRLDVRVVENRGRDIAPKYVGFADVYERGYDLLLFLHTKKSSYADGTGTPWRRYLFDSLAGNPDRVRGVMELFRSDERLGVVAPDHFGAIASDTIWQGTYLHASRLARRMGIRVVRWAPPDFASGSMFWARPEALRPITDLGLRMRDFPPEARQVTATTMHALERLVFTAAARAGYRSALLLPDGAPPRPSTAAAPAPSRPPLGMWLNALLPTVQRMVADVEIRRRRFAPGRLGTSLIRRLRARTTD